MQTRSARVYRGDTRTVRIGGRQHQTGSLSGMNSLYLIHSLVGLLSWTATILQMDAF